MYIIRNIIRNIPKSMDIKGFCACNQGNNRNAVAIGIWNMGKLNNQENLHRELTELNRENTHITHNITERTTYISFQ